MLRLFILIALLISSPVWGADDKNVISDGDDKRLMLKGNDPVSYFTQPAPLAGRPDIKTEHDGVTYRFANEENKRTFLAAPGKYAPQYGGFCSNGLVYAIPLGGGENYKIINGKLYMFGGARSKAYFEMDEEKNVKLADHYWQTEVKGQDWREQSRKRLRMGNRVDHYKTNRQLAAEYEEYLKKKQK
jgi:YHS domain-containing protein